MVGYHRRDVMMAVLYSDWLCLMECTRDFRARGPLPHDGTYRVHCAVTLFFSVSSISLTRQHG